MIHWCDNAVFKDCGKRRILPEYHVLCPCETYSITALKEGQHRWQYHAQIYSFYVLLGENIAWFGM